MSDAFTRDLFRWLLQVAGDASLRPTSARLAIILSRYINRGTGDAWPSIPTLAGDLGVVETCIRKSLKEMVAGGHLKIEAGGGRNSTNRYSLILKEEKPCTVGKGNDPGKPSTQVQGKSRKPCTGGKGFEAETLHGWAVNPTRVGRKPYPPVHPNYLKNHLKEPSEGESLSPPVCFSKPARGSNPPSKADATPEGFDEFWRTYPKRIGRFAARKAFERAVAAGATPAEITLGAARFAAERDNEPDPYKRAKFTPHPATWLHAGRWADEPSSAPAVDTNGQGRPSVFEMAFDGRLKE